jgi:UDP-N-acetylglucosamine 4-epimerase
MLQDSLMGRARSWLVTGAAGFIGSHLVEALLRLGQNVRGVDNFSTGRQENLDAVRKRVGPGPWSQFQLLEGDIVEPEVCREACHRVELVLHQAALGSVPRSIEDPVSCHRSNVTGFLNLLVAARDAKVARFVYASSSSVYGDDPDLPKVEDRTGCPLSPYAASKRIGELYAEVFARTYGLSSVGLRYFNVFGPRQDPNGPYAAVIPRWIAAMQRGEAVCINGDGESSRDFCFVENVVQANLLAAATTVPEALNQVYNIALGARTTLNELRALIEDGLRGLIAGFAAPRVVYRDFRAGDVRHSLADISKAKRLLGYAPTQDLPTGLQLTLQSARLEGLRQQVQKKARSAT